MKPDWRDAPEWANWLAMDGDGWWNWYQYEPEWDEDDDQWVILEIDEDGKYENASVNGPDEYGIDWDHAFDTLDPRP